MYYYSDNPARDYDNYCAYQDRELERLPKCIYCSQPIQDEKHYIINDEHVCHDCLVLNFEVDTDDFIE